MTLIDHADVYHYAELGTYRIQVLFLIYWNPHLLIIWLAHGHSVMLQTSYLNNPISLIILT